MQIFHNPTELLHGKCLGQVDRHSMEHAEAQYHSRVWGSQGGFWGAFGMWGVTQGS